MSFRGTFRGSFRGTFGMGWNAETTVERAGEAGESAETTVERAVEVGKSAEKTAEGNESRRKSKESVAESNEKSLGTYSAAVCAAPCAAVLVAVCGRVDAKEIVQAPLGQLDLAVRQLFPKWKLFKGSKGSVPFV